LLFLLLLLLLLFLFSSPPPQIMVLNGIGLSYVVKTSKGYLILPYTTWIHEVEFLCICKCT
jgi:hypothetical protein